MEVLCWRSLEHSNGRYVDVKIIQSTTVKSTLKVTNLRQRKPCPTCKKPFFVRWTVLRMCSSLYFFHTT